MKNRNGICVCFFMSLFIFISEGTAGAEGVEIVNQQEGAFFLFDYSALNGSLYEESRGVNLGNLLRDYALAYGMTIEDIFNNASDEALASYASRRNYVDQGEFDGAMRNAMIIRAIARLDTDAPDFQEQAFAVMRARGGEMNIDDIMDFASNLIELFNQHYDMERLRGGENYWEVVSISNMIRNLRLNLIRSPNVRDIGVCRDMHNVVRRFIARGFGIDEIFTTGFVSQVGSHRTFALSADRETYLADYTRTWRNQGFGPSALTQLVDTFGIAYRMYADSASIAVPSHIGIGLNYAVGGMDEDLDPGLHFDSSNSFRLRHGINTGRGFVGSFLYASVDGTSMRMSGLASNISLVRDVGRFVGFHTELGAALYGMDRTEVNGEYSNSSGLFIRLGERLVIDLPIGGAAIRLDSGARGDGIAAFNEHEGEESGLNIDGTFSLDHGAAVFGNNRRVGARLGARVRQYLDANNVSNADMLAIFTPTLTIKAEISLNFSLARVLFDTTLIIRNLNTGRAYSQIEAGARVEIPNIRTRFQLTVRQALSQNLPAFIPSEGLFEGRIDRRMGGCFDLSLLVRAEEGTGYSPEAMLFLRCMN